MNRIYKTVWNEQTRTFVAVSELARSRGKRSGASVAACASVTASIGTRLSWVSGALAAAGLMLFGASALADVTLPNSLGDINTDGAEIIFSNGAGSIRFLQGGTIDGLTATALAANSTAAVTGGQLFSVSQSVNQVQGLVAQGWNIKAGSEAGAGQNIQPGDTVSVNGGQNINVTRTGGVLNIATTDSLTATSLVVSGSTTLSGGANLNGSKITNLADGSVIQNGKDAVTGGQLYTLEQKLYTNGAGVKYFHAESILDDSISSGMDSIAIGPESISAGQSSFAAGLGATTAATAEGAVALGQGASVGSDVGLDGVGSIAIGRASAVGGTSNTAIGDGATVQSNFVSDSIALGSGASVNGAASSSALAIGHQAVAAGAQAAALGARASATSASATAIGNGAAATDVSAVAIGDGAVAATANSVSLGKAAGVGTAGNNAGDRTSHIAIGTNAGQNVVGNQTTAIGFGAGSGVSGDNNVAIGSLAGNNYSGDQSVAIGFQANYNNGASVAREHSTAIGAGTRAGANAVAVGFNARGESEGAVAVGANASATTGWGVAIGRDTSTTGDSVALGARSQAIVPVQMATGYITGAAAPNSVVSVGNANLQRRIVNVADGSSGYDAVNVRQLTAAQTDVASIIGGGVKLEDGKLVGPDASFGPIKIGNQYYASINDAFSSITSPGAVITPVDPALVKYDTNTSNGRITLQGGPNGTVISGLADGTQATDAVNLRQLDGAIAEGKSKYFSVNATIPGNRDNSGADGTNAIAIGPEATALGNSSIALGAQSSAQSVNAVAIGTSTQALGVNSSVLGNNSLAYGSGGVAIGQQAVSQGVNSIVIGTNAQADPKSPLATVNNAVVIGTGAEATADDGMAMGRSALASELRSVAHGYDAESTGIDATAIGSSSRASATNAYASGTGAQASGANSIASGTGARGYATNALAIGSGAVSGIANPSPLDAANNVDTIAIGTRSQAVAKNSIALGVDSTTRNAYASTTSAYSLVAHDDAKSGVLSVGSHDASSSNSTNGTIERRITNVAGGAGDTDAVNVLQLKALDKLLTERGMNFSADAGAPVHRDLGQTLAIRGAATTNGIYSGANISTYTNPATGTINISMAQTPNFTGANMGDGKITHVGAGTVSTTSTDAINGSQLYAVANNPITFAGNTGSVERKLGETQVIRGSLATADAASSTNIRTQVNAAGQMEILLASNLTADSLTINNGGPVLNNTGINMGGKKITNVAAGTAGTDAVNLNQLNTVGDTANLGWNLSANGAGSTKVAPGTAVDLASATDNNVVITKNATNQVKFGLADDINVTNDLSVGGNTAIAGNTSIAGGLAVTGASNLDGGVRVGTNFTVNPNTQVNMGGNKVTNVGAGTVSNTSTDAINGSQLYAVANSPITFAGNTGSVERKLGETQVIRGSLATADAASSANIRTQVNAAGQMEILLASNLTADSLTINNGGPVLNNTGINMGGKKITNVAAGTAGTDAVNLNQLNAVGDVANLGWNLSANGANSGKVAPGATVDLANTDGNIDIDKVGNQVTFNLAKDIEVDSVTAGNTAMNSNGVTIKGGTAGDILLTNTGLTAGTVIVSSTTGINAGGFQITNVKAGVAPTDAVNVSQLTGVQQDLNNLGDRAVKYDGNVGDPKNKITLEGNVSTDGGRTGGTTVTNVARGDISAGSTDAVNGSQIHDMGNSIAQGMGGNSSFVDGKLVTELAVGGNTYGNVNDALNGVQTNIDNVSNVANMGWNVQTNGDTASKVAPGGNVQFINGDNVQITRDGTNITVGVSKDIKVETVTANTVTANEVAIVDGPKINKDGIDMRDKQITNLAEGRQDGDAVNMAQINRLAGGMAGQINRLDNKIDRVDNRASAGVAAALATAGLPQAYLPGKSMFSLGGGTWRGESGYAMGLSTVSDNGKWLVKGSASGSSRGDYGGSVGVGYQW